MKDKEIILGINTSHDTSVAVLEDGVLIDVFEEERSRRSKYWSPVDDHPYDNSFGLLCIDHKHLHNPTHLALARFDRREMRLKVNKRVYSDRILQEKLIGEFSATQLSMQRLEEIISTWPLWRCWVL